MNGTVKKIFVGMFTFLCGVFSAFIAIFFKRACDSNKVGMESIEAGLDKITDNQREQSAITNSLRGNEQTAGEVLADIQTIIDRVESRNKNETN